VFLADLARLQNAYEAWQNTNEPDRPQALLQGLLLNHAHQWLDDPEHPRRFFGASMEPLRAFIELSWRKTKKSESIGKLEVAVVRLQDYCKVRISEERGADVGFSREMLPKDTLLSPMEHAQNLEQVFSDTKLFLSPETTSEMQAL